MKRKLSLIAASTLMLAGAQSAMAATDPTTASFAVTATVQAQCAVGNTSTLGLGVLNVIDASSANPAASTTADTNSTTFDAICTSGTANPQFKFDSANAATGKFYMVSGANKLAYSLSEGASATTAITPSVATTFGDFSANGIVNTLKITGSVAATDKQSAPVGDYSDTVTITVSFDTAS